MATRGYLTSRKFGPYFMPVNVQTLVIRNYCTAKKVPFSLPVCENFFPNSYVVLNQLVDNNSDIDIIMCSSFMLPSLDSQKNGILESCLDKRIRLHFVFEGIQLIERSDLDMFILIDRLRSVSLCRT